MSAALEAIAAERLRQIEVEGWTPEHDDEHGKGELAKAAACYAVSNRSIGWLPASSSRARLKALWPWDVKWWKPKNRRRDLVRAGALIIAEIERLDRAACPTATQEGGARPRVYHLGAALQALADELGDQISPRQREALYQASGLLWDAPSHLHEPQSPTEQNQGESQ